MNDWPNNIKFNEPEHRLKEINLLFGDNCFMVNADNFHVKNSDDTFYKKAAEFILQNFKNSNKQKIIFDTQPEGLINFQFYSIHKIAEILITKLNFNKNNLGIANGCLNLIENTQFYRYHCKKNNWIELAIKFAKSYESFNQKTIFEEINNTPTVKSSKYLCYNNSAKEHRVFLVSQLIKKNLHKKGYLSCNLKPNNEGFFLNLNLDNELFFGNFKEEIETTLKNNQELFPMDLGAFSELDYNRMLSISDIDIHHYSNSYFGIITESKFYHDKYITNEITYNSPCLDAYFISEKTYKFIQAKLPFILMGFTGSLQALKKLGYKTFHPYIDETYDIIENDIDRLCFIVNEIERLCNLNDSEWLDLQNEIIPVTKFNFETLKERGK